MNQSTLEPIRGLRRSREEDLDPRSIHNQLEGTFSSLGGYSRIRPPPGVNSQRGMYEKIPVVEVPADIKPKYKVGPSSWLYLPDWDVECNELILLTFWKLMGTSPSIYSKACNFPMTAWKWGLGLMEPLLSLWPMTS